jgi:glycogen synthase
MLRPFLQAIITKTMKIAFVSYEYPPDTAIGGIATYVEQAAKMLVQRAHHVEVFTASPTCQETTQQDQVVVHRIQTINRAQFAQEIAPIFAKRHRSQQFNVLEGPDCGADAAKIKQDFPDLPLVLKLHTPSYLLQRLSHQPLSFTAKARFILGGLRRGQLPHLPKPSGVGDRLTDPEYHHALQADVLAAPCQAIADQIQQDWQLESKPFVVFPLPYSPTSTLLDIPLTTRTNRITFIGRLEVRKGILDLMQAIPPILRQYPAAKFRFVGPAWPSPQRNQNMQEYLYQKLWRYRHALEFTGAVPLERIPEYLTQTDICVFPSIWENFPLVCLEAMAAGRGIVGSNAGGMADLLDRGNAGLLIPPQQPDKIASAILKLLRNPELREHYGQIARARILQHYKLDVIAQLQESCYHQAIAQQSLPSSLIAL